MRLNNSAARETESEEQTRARLDAKRARTAASRETESEEQNRSRLEADRDKTAAARETESVEQKNARLNANRDNMKKMRNTESDNKKKNTLLRATISDVDPFSVGLMNQVRSCCNALMFAGETHSGKLGVNGEPGTASFSMCCR